MRKRSGDLRFAPTPTALRRPLSSAPNLVTVAMGGPATFTITDEYGNCLYTAPSAAEDKQC